jgi:hypothetical protein
MVYEPNRRRDPEAEEGSRIPEMGRAGTRIALLLVLPSLVLLFLVPRGSAEFVITVVTLVIGLAFLAVVSALVWWVNHRL